MAVVPRAIVVPSKRIAFGEPIAVAGAPPIDRNTSYSIAPVTALQ